MTLALLDGMKYITLFTMCLTFWSSGALGAQDVLKVDTSITQVPGSPKYTRSRVDDLDEHSIIGRWGSEFSIGLAFHAIGLGLGYTVLSDGSEDDSDLKNASDTFWASGVYVGTSIPLTAFGISAGGYIFTEEVRYGPTILGTATGSMIGSLLSFAVSLAWDNEYGMAIQGYNPLIVATTSLLGGMIGYELGARSQNKNALALAPTASIAEGGGSIGLVGSF